MLGDAVQEANFNKGDKIIAEGEVGNIFFIISEGTCIATKNMGEAEPTQIMEYERGHYFGERALLTNENRAANIIVTSNVCQCLTLDRKTFTRLLGPL